VIVFKVLLNFRYDPSSDMTLDIDSVQDRVLLIKSVVQFMVNRQLLFIQKHLYNAPPR